MSGDSAYLLFNIEKEVITREDVNNLVQSISKKTLFQFATTYDDILQKQTINATQKQGIDQVWEKFEREESNGINLEFQDDHDFELTIWVMPRQLNQLAVVVDNGYLSDIESINYQNVQSLIQICELVYATLHPIYAYGFTSPEIDHTIANPDDEVTIRAVHDYNFFGPYLVQKIGREKILTIPTWRTVQFDDGGILLAMSPNPIAEWEPYTENYKNAAKILGVKQFYQGG